MQSKAIRFSKKLMNEMNKETNFYKRWFVILLGSLLVLSIMFTLYVVYVNASDITPCTSQGYSVDYCLAI